MKKTTKQILAAGAVLVMSGCNSITGTLTVNTGQNLQLKDKKGNLVTLPEGNATVVMSSGKIQLKGNTSNGKKDTIELDALKNMLPAFQTSGSHMFLAKDTGQPVDINEITVNSDSVSNQHFGWETCNQVVTVEVPCPQPVVVEPDHGGNGDGGDDGHKNPPPKQPEPPKKGDGKHASLSRHHKNRQVAEVCTDNRVVEGRQKIQFHFDGDNFEIQLIMSDPASGAQIASFDGYSYSSDRIVDQYLSECLIH